MNANTKNKKVLIVDDDEPMRELLQLYLHTEGYDTGTAFDGENALEQLKKEHYDMILLDLMMPNQDGFDICKEIRHESNIPIIMLTAREETIDKVIGLKIGADDYMTKPFEYQELLARIESVFRRERLQTENPDSHQSFLSKRKTFLTYRGLQLNQQTHQVFHKNHEILLTPKEYGIFQLFLSNKGRIFHREDILELLWKTRPVNDDRTVDTHIKNLREKLTLAGIAGQDIIRTVWGTGFICNEDT